MTRFVFALAGAAALAVSSGSAFAASSTLDFSSLNHGDVVSRYGTGESTIGLGDNQFNLDNGVNVSVSARVSGTGHERAVIFDTTQTGTEDWDLEDHDVYNGNQGFKYKGSYAGTAALSGSSGSGKRYTDNLYGSEAVGNVLILQEDGNNCSGSSCNSPDDNGARPAGFFFFQFDQDVIVDSIDFVDVEDCEEAMVWFIDDTSNITEQTLEDIEGNLSGNDIFAGVNITPITGYTYSRYGEDSNSGSNYYCGQVVCTGVNEGENIASVDGMSISSGTEDNYWSRMTFDFMNATSGFRGMLVKMGGSGAISDIRLHNSDTCTSNCGGTDVPEPASLLLFGTALATVTVVGRRRRRRLEEEEAEQD